MSFCLSVAKSTKLPRSLKLVLVISGWTLPAFLFSGCQAIQVAGTSAGISGPIELSPAITSQPANISVTLGTPATFSVTATGTGTLDYQWQHNAANIPGATSSSYTTPEATGSDNGSTFDVVVSNAAGSTTGSTTSSTATLTLLAAMPPSITSQPLNESVTAGQSAIFSASATGTGTLTYQWQQNSADIEGATSASYTTPPTIAADSGSTFDVVVSNSAGSTTSNSATLLVTTPAQASYYVALNGSDTADGSASSPFATLQRAQRAMQQSAIKVTQINAGTYYLSSPLTLTEADQGETWEAVAGATVILSGGELLTGWTDQDNGIYSALAAKPVGLDLAIAGVRQIPAALGYYPLRPFISGWRVLNPNQPHNFGVTFTVPSTDMTASVKPGATVQVLDFLRYSDQITTIVSVDQANNTITVAGQFNTGTTSPGVSGSWRVLNDPADLGAPGEFAYDAATAKVYIDPANPDSLTSDPVVAATLSTLIVLNNVSGVTISGLTLSDTTSNRNYY